MAALTPRIVFSMDEREAARQGHATVMRGYISEMGEHPQTIGYALAGFTDRAGGLDARSRRGQLREDLPRLPRRQPSGNLTRDHVLDNITLYWLTNTAASAARLYWETDERATASFKDPPPHVKLPVGYTVFPDELFQAPRLGEERLPQPHLLQRGRPRAATSRRGKSRSSSRPSCAPRSAHSGDKRSVRSTGRVPLPRPIACSSTASRPATPTDSMPTRRATARSRSSGCTS